MNEVAQGDSVKEPTQRKPNMAEFISAVLGWTDNTLRVLEHLLSVPEEAIAVFKDGDGPEQSVQLTGDARKGFMVALLTIRASLQESPQYDLLMDLQQAADTSEEPTHEAPGTVQ